MKHILIPTDFSVESLNAVHAAVSLYNNSKIKLTLFHLLELSADISELLFYNSRRMQTDLVGREFHEACEILQNKYVQEIECMNIRFGNGNTIAYLRNFMLGAGIDRIVMCEDIRLGMPSKRSVNMSPLLKRTGIPIDLIPTRPARQEVQTDISIISMSKSKYIVNQ